MQMRLLGLTRLGSVLAQGLGSDDGDLDLASGEAFAGLA
jgi:hypothetical protein